MQAGLILLAGVAYALALFAGAAWVQRRGGTLNRFLRMPAYVLALAVYCTSWTYYGAVGTAVSSGWAYLPIYLGPILLFLLAPRFLRRLVQSVKDEGATSLSDFIATRFGKDKSLSALLTILALAGTVPYLGLQLRSVGTTYQLLAGGGDLVRAVVLAAIALAVFAIMFGARRYESGRGDGAVQFAVAAESLVKLVALCLVAALSLYLVSKAPPDVVARGLAGVHARFAPSEIGVDFVVRTLLAMLAIICLPRQFYVAVIQARTADDIVRARLPFVGYLVLTILAVLPVVVAGIALLPGAPPDFLVLSVPMTAGLGGVALFVFLGGLSAVTGMVVTECIALSTMVANDLVAPILLRNPAREEANVGRRLLAARRATIALLLAAAAFYALNLPISAQLASVGVVAFAGLAQAAPCLIHAVYRGDGDPVPAKAGIVTGMLFWGYMLFLPSVGIEHPDWLDPARRLGLDGFSSVTQGTIFSLGGNLAAFALATVMREAAPRLHLPLPFRGHRNVESVTSMAELTALVERFVGPVETARAFPGPTRGEAVDGVSARRAERLIAGVVGASSAHRIMGSALAGDSLRLDDIAKILDASATNLHFSRGLLAATLENIAPGVSVVDRDLRLIAWNSRYLELFDYPPGMVRIGTPVADLIRYNARTGEMGPGEVEEQVARRLMHMHSGTPHSFERRRRDGRVVKTVGGPMPDGGYVMCFTDITAETEARESLERARAELEARVRDRTAALSDANDKLARATAEKTRFLAAASHDLLQPLHAARLFAASLRRDVPPEAQPALARVDQSIAAANDLLRALLDISKLDAGGIVPHVQSVALRPMLEELVAGFMPMAVERGVSLRLGAGSATVETDPTLLRSIIQNFLSNAVRYTMRGGIVVGVRRRGGEAVIEVYDTGAGIPETKREAIFREFERLGTVDAPGIGLGLAIVERTAALLGARIGLASVEGRGSRFSVALPLADPPQGAAPKVPLLPAAGASEFVALRIMVIDDDPAICEAMAALLTSEGHDVVTLASGEAAFDLKDDFRIDAALIDFDLGDGMDGIATARALQARRPELAMALVTAERDGAVLGRARRAGMAILPKPLAAEALELWLADVGR